MSSRTDKYQSIQEVTTAFSLTWLILANLVGVLLAGLLLHPGLNDWMSPFSYGRWVPLHMDWQLYGWCSIPLLGILYRHFMDGVENAGMWVTSGFSLWSIGLLAGGISWLNGGSTGKLFLNWGGIAGCMFAAALLANWTILALAWLTNVQNRNVLKISVRVLVFKVVVLSGLLVVPVVLLYTSNPSVYPPVNPDSGGATGHSLLASSLSLVFLMGLFPGSLLGLKKKEGRRTIALARAFWITFGISLVVYLSINHGDASNYEWNQILGLGSLLVWPALVWGYWNRFEWSAGSSRWRLAFLFWWGMLAVDGWLIFLPGNLDVLKFTNALVAHSHLAMGGMVTALNMLIMYEAGNSIRVRYTLSSGLSFWLWNMGCLLYVVVMTIQGWHEGNHPSVLFANNLYTEINYGTRLIAGIAMLSASLLWAFRIFFGEGASAWMKVQRG